MWYRLRLNLDSEQELRPQVDGEGSHGGVPEGFLGTVSLSRNRPLLLCERLIQAHESKGADTVDSEWSRRDDPEDTVPGTRQWWIAEAHFSRRCGLDLPYRQGSQWSRRGPCSVRYGLRPDLDSEQELRSSALDGVRVFSQLQ